MSDLRLADAVMDLLAACGIPANLCGVTAEFNEHSATEILAFAAKLARKRAEAAPAAAPGDAVAKILANLGGIYDGTVTVELHRGRRIVCTVSQLRAALSASPSAGAAAPGDRERGPTAAALETLGRLMQLGETEVQAVGQGEPWPHGGAMSPKYYVKVDGMTWPHPHGEVEYDLRYGEPPQRASVLVAASYVAAYRELVLMPERQRRQIIRALRAGTPTGGDPT